MADRRAVLLGTALVTLIMVLSAMGLLLVVAPANGTHSGALAVSSTTSPGRAGGSVAPTAPIAGGPAGRSNVAPATVNVNPLAEKALTAAKAAGVPTRDVFVPRAGATPEQAAHAAAQGHVTPLYTEASPAPIGLAYYGLSANTNGNGSVVASDLNTTSLLATFAPNATGVVGAYPFSSSPDAYGVQLNAVSTSINLFGNSSYSMWTQNVVEFYPSSGTLYLVTNVWNFSGGGLSSNAIYAHGAYGNYVPGTFYYSEYVVTGLSYPFTISLWMNNSVNATRNMVSFSVGINDPGNPSVSGGYPYDYVVFNSTSASPSNYEANGFAYNALGLTNDFEVILGGPGGGSTSDLFAADANLSLQYWNSSASTYQEVPTAFSYGGETGETVTGANVAWNTNSSGAPYGEVTTGPSILEGLWNATGPSGDYPLTLAITPSNAIYLIGPNAASNFSYQWDPYWAPQEMTNGIFWLAPGVYNLSILLSDYTPVYTTFTMTSAGVTITMSLTANAALGIYAPMYFWNNNQFAALSTGGTGTTTDPYQIDNTQVLDFPSVFGLFNDYTFPVFSGVFIWGTTASVVLNDMPALTTGSPYINLPATNDLGYTFYFASNVALTNSTQLSGWWTTNVDSGIGSGFVGNYYATFSVVEWNSSDVLIAGNTFLTQTGGLYMADGYDNTVWGNTFDMVAIPVFSICPALCALNLSLGLEIAEGLGLVYNNAFYTNNTAVAPPFDLYTGQVTFWTDTWNITPTPAATVNYAAAWPNFPLSGTIIGNLTQGGNFWWDYGTLNNPLGVLPYDEYNGYTGQTEIYDGGDYYPLIYTDYTVTFTESGLTAGTTWTVTLNGVPQHSASASIQFTEIDGTYAYTVGLVAGYNSPSPLSGDVTVDNANPATVTVTYTPIVVPPTYTSTFTETGLPAGSNWSVTLNSVLQYSDGTATVTFTGLSNGAYSFTVTAVSGYTANVTSGMVTVSGADTSNEIGFTAVTPATYTVTFTETGLPSGTSWTVTLAGTPNTETTASISFSGLVNNTYAYTIGTVTGYTSSPTSSSVIVAGTSPTVTVAFTATSSPPPASSSNNGLSTLDYAIIGVVIAIIIIALLVALAMRGRSGGGGSGGKPSSEGESGETTDDGSSGGGSA
ncbi:MAG: thermopsin family protease [Thermoplasmata archaeon]